MSTSSSSQQDARRERVVAYGSDDFDRAVASVKDAIQEGEGMIFLFVGASKEEKQEGMAKIADHDEWNLHRFNVRNLIGERLVETQGNLREAFDNAGEDAAVLFFDEADVLLDPSHSDEADEDDAALSDYFFDRVESYFGICVVCFSSPKYVSRLEGHEVDVVVEF